MADDDIDRRIAAAPSYLYYLAIDGTEAKDSAAFGALLEKNTGWKNLATHFLEAAPDHLDRLVDPAHPYLPIWKSEHKGKKIAVVCPGGDDCHGTDLFWHEYPGPDPVMRRRWPELNNVETVGRLTAAEESALFMQKLILHPALEIVKRGTKTERRFADPGNLGTPVATFAANLLYVSSHGWLGGFMRGNVVEALATARPVPAAGVEYVVRNPYFIVGRAAKDGLGFSGPQWIVLAQCSTLNSATWPLWARVLAMSNPHVRGILAYEEASPAAAPAISIARNFFDALLRKVPFLDAWKQANPGQKWAAIVHKEATGDTLQKWTKFAPLGSVALGTSAKDFNYRGYLSAKPHGEPIFDVPEPFDLKLEWVRGTNAIEILPEGLHRAVFASGEIYKVTITARAGETLVGATLIVHHIRPTHPHQFKTDTLFETIGTDSDWTHTVSGDRRTLVLKPKRAGLTQVTLAFLAADLSKSGLEAHHSYLWPTATVTTSAGKRSHDFKTKGLSYYGG